MNEVKFSVRVTVKDMFAFLMHHSYRGVSLLADAIVTFGAIGLLVAGFGKGDPVKTVALIFVALLFTVVHPLQLYNRARKQVKGNEVFNLPLDYVLTDEGITLSQGEQSQSITWGDVYQVKEYKSQILVYTGRVYAFVWPKSALAECEDEVRELFKKHLPEKVAGKSVK
ncbi:MAG: YcxB family protein [Lachnospiraceae bacterium]|nr:YcxB family protein [Lachnospiraceae bacterium]